MMQSNYALKQGIVNCLDVLHNLKIMQCLKVVQSVPYI